MTSHADEEREYEIFATVMLRGASMTVLAKSEAEAREKATDEPDFDFNGAEMANWVITRVKDITP